MPSIKPVSALKNYTSIVNEVSYGNRIYFTKNGHGQCALVDIAELDDLDKQKALLQLMTKLAEAKLSVREERMLLRKSLDCNMKYKLEYSQIVRRKLWKR